MKFCPQCGSELKEGARFCANCGFQIAQMQAPPPAPTPQSTWQQPEPAYSQAPPAFTNAFSGNTSLFQRVKNILTTPKQEWPAINQEQPDTVKLLFGYALVLALIPAIALFIRYGLIGTTVCGVTNKSISWGIS